MQGPGRGLSVLTETPSQTPARRWGLPHHKHEKVNATNNVNSLVLRGILHTGLGDLEQRHQLCCACPWEWGSTEAIESWYWARPGQSSAVYLGALMICPCCPTSNTAVCDQVNYTLALYEAHSTSECSAHSRYRSPLCKLGC